MRTADSKPLLAVAATIVLVVVSTVFSDPASAGTDPGPLVSAASAPAHVHTRHEATLIRNSSPAIGDVNGDGIQDVAVGGQDGRLRVFDRGDLTDVLWTAAVPPHVPFGCHPQATPTSIDSAPVIADVDGDGRSEIIVGSGSTYVAQQNGGLTVFEHDGSVKWRWTGASDVFDVWDPSNGRDGWCEGVYSTSAVGDVDGDGDADIVFGGWDHLIHALDGRTGAELAGFPYDIVDTIWSSPALHDIDGDGRVEIFIGGDDTCCSPGHWAGGQIHSLDWNAGQVHVRWKLHPDEVVMGSPAIGDVNGDGRLEMVVTTGAYYHNATSRSVLVHHLDDGSTVPGWPRTTGGILKASPALADLDGDAVLDVVIGGWDGYVHAFRGNGTKLWETKICCNPAAESLNSVNSSPIVGDIDGDGDNDVIVGSGWGMQVLDGPTGAKINELAWGLSYDNAAALGDFGPRGRHLITVGFSLPANRTDLNDYAIDSDAPIPWPAWRGAGGGMPPDPPCPDPDTPHPTGPALTGDGYWMLGQRGKVYDFGDVDHHGDASGALTDAPTARALDIEPTPSSRGYWILDTRGCVMSFGDAEHHGDVDRADLQPGETVSSLSAADGDGYLVFTNRGRTIPFGTADHLGDMVGTPLNGPVLGSTTTPSGDGYYMVGSDGGIFAFGDAAFRGSMGGIPLNEPVSDLVPISTNNGYWLVASDGGVFAFDAPFRGSMGAVTLNKPVVGMVRYGNGYLMVGSDGGVFNFSDKEFKGSLGANPPSVPITAIAAIR